MELSLLKISSEIDYSRLWHDMGVLSEYTDMKRWIYELIYRFPFVPIDWIFGSSSGIENLAELAING